LVCLLCTILFGCASRVPPDGGAKDTTPPKIVSTIPSQNAINTRPEKVEFAFDEFIELKDGGSGILISPPMLLMPDIQLKGKSVVLRMKQAFDENTTYTISLGGAIKDITEANVVEPYSLVFSTGPLLDSLVVSGRVIDSYANSPVKDALVMLYLSMADSLPKKQLPRYFSQTDESGNFTIQNVKAGFYSIFALKDANKNYLYDQPGEAVGFQDKMVHVDSGVVKLGDIRISAENPVKQRLIKTTFHAPSTLTLKYALPVSDIVIENVEDRSIIPFYKNPESTKDSLILNFPRIENDSLNVFIRIDENSIDTLSISTKRAVSKFQGKKSQAAPDTSLKFTSNIDKGKLLPSSVLELKSNYPTKLLNRDKVFWIIDTDTIPAELESSIASGFHWKYLAIPPKNPGKTIKFLALGGVFEDFYGRSSDTLKLDFRKMDVDETGNIELLVKDTLGKPDLDLIIELIDAKKKLINSRKVKNGDLVIYSELSPGTYSLRIIEDLNGNGIWDPGVFSSRQQAESMVYYNDVVSVRAGWDLAIEWDIYSIEETELKQKK